MHIHILNKYFLRYTWYRHGKDGFDKNKTDVSSKKGYFMCILYERVGRGFVISYGSDV